jgi:FAD/FMN-containing dehydrogenase
MTTIPESALRGLAAAVDGTLRLPDDPEFGSLSSLFNKRYAHRRPAAVVSVANVEDVRRTIRWAREHDVPFVARSSGHSYAGYSVGDGLVIDLSRLNAVTADGGTGLVTLGGGAVMTDLFPKIEPLGMAFPAGNSPTVGIAGLTLGGGVAVTSRSAGLTCDSLLETTIVTADGDVLVCSENENSDLFWACRGAGGGSLGVNVSFTFQARPVSDVSLCVLVWNHGDEIALLTALQEAVRTAPDEFSARLGISTDGLGPDRIGGNRIVTAVGQYSGPSDELRQILAPAYAIAAPVRERMMDLTYWEAKDFLGHATSGDAFAARNRITSRPLPAAALETMLAYVRRWPGSGNSDGGGIGLFSWGGAMNRVAADATAFPHRDAMFLISMDTSWTADDPADLVDANLDWLNGLYDAMGAYAPDAAYQNFTDPDLRDWRTAYYGANYPRLAAVKHKYDPDNVFRSGQDIAG